MVLAHVTSFESPLLLGVLAVGLAVGFMLGTMFHARYTSDRHCPQQVNTRQPHG